MFFFGLCGFWIWTVSTQYWYGQIQNIESLKRLYSVCWGGNKWPRRPLGVNYSVEACGHCVKVGLVVLLLKRELDSLTESLRWWWSGWPPLLVTMWVIPEDLGNFSPKKEKNLGEQKFSSFGVEFSQIMRNVVFELTSFFFWNSLLTELSKPCTLSLTNMHKNTEQRENKEVSRWMSH